MYSIKIFFVYIKRTLSAFYLPLTINVRCANMKENMAVNLIK